MSICFQNILSTDEEYSLSELIKFKCEVLVKSLSKQVVLSLKQNHIKIASHSFTLMNEDETWLYIILDKKIQYGRAQIDSIKIKVKCQIKSALLNSNAVNNNKGDIHVHTHEGYFEQKKVKLNNLIKDLLKTPLFDTNPKINHTAIAQSNTNECNRVNSNGNIDNKRSKSVNKNYAHNQKQINHRGYFYKHKTTQAFKSVSQSKKIQNGNNSSVFTRKKSIELDQGIRHKNCFDSTTYSDLNRRQSKTPRNHFKIKQLFLAKKSGAMTDEKITNDHYSTTRESIPDNNCNNEIYLLRQQIEENFNDLINKERDLIKNDTNLFEIEPSISYFMNDLIMDDDDDHNIDEIHQTQFEGFSNLRHQLDHNDASNLSLLKAEANVLMDKAVTMRNSYRIRAKDYQEKFVKYKELFIYHSENYLQLSKMHSKLKQFNEESKLIIQNKGLIDKHYSRLNENLVKANKREVMLLEVAFNNIKTSNTKKVKLSQILAKVLKSNTQTSCNVSNGRFKDNKIVSQGKAIKRKLALTNAYNCNDSIKKQKVRTNSTHIVNSHYRQYTINPVSTSTSSSQQPNSSKVIILNYIT